MHLQYSEVRDLQGAATLSHWHSSELLQTEYFQRICVEETRQFSLENGRWRYSCKIEDGFKIIFIIIISAFYNIEKLC